MWLVPLVRSLQQALLRTPHLWNLNGIALGTLLHFSFSLLLPLALTLWSTSTPLRFPPVRSLIQISSWPSKSSAFAFWYLACVYTMGSWTRSGGQPASLLLVCWCVCSRWHVFSLLSSCRDAGTKDEFRRRSKPRSIAQIIAEPVQKVSASIQRRNGAKSFWHQHQWK